MMAKEGQSAGEAPAADETGLEPAAGDVEAAAGDA
jgi:hypothetical protein